MSNLVVDGFATYGNGLGLPSAAVDSAMLAGAYAQIGPGVTTTLPGDCSIQQGLPWNPTDTTFWINANNTAGGANSGLLMAARRVIPQGPQSTVMISCHVSLTQLPAASLDGVILDLRDINNNLMGQLLVGTTGVLIFQPVGGGALQSTTAVIVAQKVHHIEGSWNMSTGAVLVNVDEVGAISGTATYSGAASVAQINICGSNLYSGQDHNWVHMADLIIRNTSGTVNNSFPVGDRKVATIYPAVDDPSNNGWASFPLLRFGTGILDNTENASAAVRTVATNIGNIGNGDFTLEGQFRLNANPTGSNKAVLFGKWTEDNNARSYQLYLGGPTLETGFLVFRTSTDGTSGTVVEKLKWPWNPVIGQWYHVAVSRTSGVLRLFINGVQAGVNVADTDTYYAATTPSALCGQITSLNNVLANTSWNGWQDEFRLTVGVGRYTSNFTPPAAAFPRNVGGDPSWLSVAWLSGWDNSSIADDGPNGISLLALNGSTFMTPSDGQFKFQDVNKAAPFDATFIAASLLPATGIFTLSANPANNDTVTVATKSGGGAAVYTFKTAIASAYDVLIGANAAATMANLVNAINAGAGAGTTYGTGTVANNDVSATLLPTNQMQVTALIPGTGGNSLASTTTSANGSWTGTTLAGGQNIPSPQAFTFQRMPPQTTIVDSVTFVSRQFKTDAGVGTTVQTMLGISGGTVAGSSYNLGTAPNLKFDTFEHDPDNTSNPLNPTVARTMRVLLNRTA